MRYGRRAAGLLIILVVGVSGLVTLPGGGGAVRGNGPETIVLGPPDTAAATSFADDEERAASVPAPAFVRIPSIGVHAAIEQAGLTPERRMENPTTWDSVAWYRHGASPGESGSAVLAGHLDSDTGTAVFWDLHTLKPGDTVDVTDVHGDVRTFTVTRNETFDAASVPMEELFSADGAPRIVLVTCEGSWSAAGGYDERQVVFAELTG